ncbi:MAG: Mth938-like domain-containing protein [Gammaproteobacteria bacterium]|nr:Mth938-like domain-containing protein [Gammaproteobacteria bacterium]
MKLHVDRTAANTVTAWGEGEIRVREQVIRNSVILTAEHIIHPWSGRHADTLDSDDMAPVLALEPNIIVLGTGQHLSFPDPALYADILARGIGLEVMDTPAACRTYNILVHEGRSVAAALMIDEALDPAPAR